MPVHGVIKCYKPMFTWLFGGTSSWDWKETSLWMTRILDKYWGVMVTQNVAKRARLQIGVLPVLIGHHIIMLGYLLDPESSESSPGWHNLYEPFRTTLEKNMGTWTCHRSSHNQPEVCAISLTQTRGSIEINQSRAYASDNSNLAKKEAMGRR